MEARKRQSIDPDFAPMKYQRHDNMAFASSYVEAHKSQSINEASLFNSESSFETFYLSPSSVQTVELCEVNSSPSEFTDVNSAPFLEVNFLRTRVYHKPVKVLQSSIRSSSANSSECSHSSDDSTEWVLVPDDGILVFLDTRYAFVYYSNISPPQLLMLSRAVFSIILCIEVILGQIGICSLIPNSTPQQSIGSSIRTYDEKYCIPLRTFFSNQIEKPFFASYCNNEAIDYILKMVPRSVLMAHKEILDVLRLCKSVFDERVEKKIMDEELLRELNNVELHSKKCPRENCEVTDIEEKEKELFNKNIEDRKRGSCSTVCSENEGGGDIPFKRRKSISVVNDSIDIMTERPTDETYKNKNEIISSCQDVISCQKRNSINYNLDFNHNGIKIDKSCFVWRYPWGSDIVWHYDKFIINSNNNVSENNLLIKNSSCNLDVENKVDNISLNSIENCNGLFQTNSSSPLNNSIKKYDILHNNVSDSTESFQEILERCGMGRGKTGTLKHYENYFAMQQQQQKNMSSPTSSILIDDVSDSDVDYDSQAQFSFDESSTPVPKEVFVSNHNLETPFSSFLNHRKIVYISDFNNDVFAAYAAALLIATGYPDSSNVVPAVASVANLARQKSNVELFDSSQKNHSEDENLENTGTNHIYFPFEINESTNKSTLRFIENIFSFREKLEHVYSNRYESRYDFDDICRKYEDLFVRNDI